MSRVQIPIDPARIDKPQFFSNLILGDGCWEWTGPYMNAYGTMRPYRGAKKIRASRIAWAIMKGEDPGDLFICHTCDNPKCVRIHHLFKGAQKQNMDDMRQKGRHHTNTKLSSEDVRGIRYLRGRGWPLLDLAELFGVSRSMVSQIYLRRARKGTHESIRES